MSEMMKQVAEAREAAKHTAATGEGGNPDGQADELPEGSSPLEAREEASENEAEASEETPVAASGEEETPAEKPILINGREFKSTSEAIAYAEELERERDNEKLYNQGVRDALAQSGRSEQPPATESEDNFDEQFYANPKETLKRVQEQATQNALAQIKAEQRKENLWNQFLSENPDVRRKDAERILQENWETIGAMTDVSRAMKVLAQKTRAEYEEIRDLGKPRTELKKTSGQAVSPAGGSPNRVTPKNKTDEPLDFMSQMRKLKR